jgi:HSP20 family protein
MSVKVAPDPPFQHLIRQANRLMDQMQKGYFNFCPSETWTPNANLYETETSYLVCVDLAGVEKSKIDLEVEGQKLTLRGTRAMPTFGGESPGETAEADSGGRRMRIHLMEIDHGAFCREIDLPADVARERIAATHDNGLLWIEIPKS